MTACDHCECFFVRSYATSNTTWTSTRLLYHWCTTHLTLNSATSTRFWRQAIKTGNWTDLKCQFSCIWWFISWSVLKPKFHYANFATKFRVHGLCYINKSWKSTAQITLSTFMICITDFCDFCSRQFPMYCHAVNSIRVTLLLTDFNHLWHWMLCWCAVKKLLTHSLH